METFVVLFILNVGNFLNAGSEQYLLFKNSLTAPNIEVLDLYTYRTGLQNMDYSEASIRLAQSKDPTIALLISILVGYFGIDRFFVGDTMMGVLKLITCGGCGIWIIIDWFLIMGVAKDKDYARFNGIF